MTSPDIAAGFRQVDQGPDPEFLIRFLDAARQNESVQECKRKIRDLLSIQPGDRLLDVGCGTGDDAIELAGLAGASGRAVGIDTSALMVAEATRRAARSGLPVEIVQGDAHRLDFPPRTDSWSRASKGAKIIAQSCQPHARFP